MHFELRSYVRCRKLGTSEDTFLKILGNILDIYSDL